MIDWRKETTVMNVRIPDQEAMARVQVSLVYDQRGKQPDKILFSDVPPPEPHPGDEERSRNTYKPTPISAMEAPVRDQVITEIAARLKTHNPGMKPRNAEWYMQDGAGNIGDKEPGKIYALSLSSQMVVRPNPLVIDLVRSNRELDRDIDELRRKESTIKVEEFTSKIQPLEQAQYQSLDGAFSAAVQKRDVGPPR